MVKTKTLGFIALNIFVLVFLMGAVSAAIVLDPNTFSESIDQSDLDSFTFTIENTDGTSDYSNFTSVVSDLTGSAGTLDSNQVTVGTLPSSLDSGDTSSSITVTIDIPSNQALGTYDGTITIDADGSTTNPNPQTINLSVTVTQDSSGDLPDEVQECSDIGNPGELRINSIDFQNNGMQFNTFGEDDEWLILEEIEAELEIENRGDFDIADVEISWGLWNTQTEEWVIDFDDEDEFDIDEGDEEVLTVTFKIDDDLDVDLDELTDGDNYKLYVTARGTIDDNNADALDGEDTCAFNDDNEGEASIIIERDFAVIDNLNVPTTAQCGAEAEIRGQVWNIGDRDQDEISLLVTNTEFGLREEIEIGDIDAFENEPFTFRFDVPNDAEERIHSLRFEVYDEDFDIYENDFDDEESIFIVPLTVASCGPSAADVIVAASLVSGGRAGQDLVVRATITNNGDELKTFNVNAADFSQFASSASADQSTLALNAGESRDVTFTLDIRRDASGEQNFFIEVNSDNDVLRQPVSVNIEPSGFLGITGFTIGGGNTLLWGLGLLNIILVIVIIIVAVRIARK